MSTLITPSALEDIWKTSNAIILTAAIATTRLAANTFAEALVEARGSADYEVSSVKIRYVNDSGVPRCGRSTPQEGGPKNTPLGSAARGEVKLSERDLFNSVILAVSRKSSELDLLLPFLGSPAVR